MKDTLLDIVQYTHSLGCIDLIKVTGTATETIINAVAEDKTVIVTGVFKTPQPQFVGVFGMPNLNKLKTILGFDEYDENSKISTKRDGDIAKAIHFENKSGDFVNDYRLMAESIVKEKVSTVIFKGATWNIEFNPTVEGIGRLKKQQQANSEENRFKVKIENGDLKIHFGDPATHSGSFVFYPKVQGTLANVLQFPVNLVIQVLNMAGDKTMRISERGILEITIDSGIATYRYLIPAQIK